MARRVIIPESNEQEDEQETELEDDLEDELEDELGDRIESESEEGLNELMTGDMEHETLQWWTTDYSKLVASMLSSLPSSVKRIHLTFQTALNVRYFQRDIHRFDWVHVGRLLSAHSGFEVLVLEFGGLSEDLTWESLKLAQLVTKKLLQGSIFCKQGIGALVSSCQAYLH